MDYNKMRILEFKLDSMEKNPAIVMIAKRGSGKSFIIRDVLYHLKDIPGGVIISPTDRLSSFYKNFFPDIFIHHDVKDNIFKKILARQVMMVEKMENKRKQGLKVNAAGILVMDDCLSRKKSWARDESILEILMNGRHYLLTYILTMQTPLGIPPELRLNFDYIFLLKEDSMINKKKLRDNYASMFPTISSFIKFHDKCTENFRSMVVNNRCSSNKIQDKVFWFRAKKRDFYFGSEKFIEIHKKYYDPNFKRKIMNRIIGDNFFNKKKDEDDVNVILV
jgi:hypothetical protein